MWQQCDLNVFPLQDEAHSLFSLIHLVMVISSAVDIKRHSSIHWGRSCHLFILSPLPHCVCKHFLASWYWSCHMALPITPSNLTCTGVVFILHTSRSLPERADFKKCTNELKIWWNKVTHCCTLTGDNKANWMVLWWQQGPQHRIITYGWFVCAALKSDSTSYLDLISW